MEEKFYSVIVAIDGDFKKGYLSLLSRVPLAAAINFCCSLFPVVYTSLYIYEYPEMIDGSAVISFLRHK